MVVVDKTPYWDKLVEYYYDHIHWNEEPVRSINQWLLDQYGCRAQYTVPNLIFDRDSDYTLFALRFSS